MSISLYDCTLRDGKPIASLGYGMDAVTELSSGLADTGLEYVELGYLSEGAVPSGLASYDSIDLAESLIPRNTATNWVVSICTGGDGLPLIPEAHGQIRTIRFAVSVSDIDSMRAYSSYIMGKGYGVICELDDAFGHGDLELLKIVDALNESGIAQVTISDRSWCIGESDLQRVYYLLDHNLNPNIRIGARFSDALKDACEKVQKLISLNAAGNRDIVIEGSLFGIGDSQGNLCIEIAGDYVNEFHGGKYRLECLYRLIGKYVQPLAGNRSWGYHPAFFLSAKYKVDGDYAQFLLDREVPLERINELLKDLGKTHAYEEFDEAVAEEAYRGA